MKRVFLFVGIVALFAVSCSNGKTDSAVADEAAQDSMKIESLEAEKDSLMSLMGEISSMEMLETLDQCLNGEM